MARGWNKNLVVRTFLRFVTEMLFPFWHNGKTYHFFARIHTHVKRVARFGADWQQLRFQFGVYVGGRQLAHV
jgi:hypothetical protein